MFFVDSHYDIHLGKNQTFHNMFRRIDVRYYRIYDILKTKLLEIQVFYNDDNNFDMMTKILLRGEYETYCDMYVW